MVHFIVAFVIYFDQWKVVVSEGLFDAISQNPFVRVYDREAAFWCLFLSPFILFIGRVCLWCEERNLKMPVSLSCLLIATVLCGVFLMPLSGIWLALPPSVMMVLKSLKPKHFENSAM
jgi:hypothetical protein